MECIALALALALALGCPGNDRAVDPFDGTGLCPSGSACPDAVDGAASEDGSSAAADAPTSGTAKPPISWDVDELQWDHCPPEPEEANTCDWSMSCSLYQQEFEVSTVRAGDEWHVAFGPGLRMTPAVALDASCDGSRTMPVVLDWTCDRIILDAVQHHYTVPHPEANRWFGLVAPLEGFDSPTCCESWKPIESPDFPPCSAALNMRLLGCE